MDEYVVHILKSLKFDKTYIGYTSDLVNRLKSHNRLSKKGFTNRYRPWKIIHLEFYSTKKEAMIREKFLKSGKGREWTKQHVRF